MQYKKILKKAMGRQNLCRKRHLFQELNPDVSNFLWRERKSITPRAASILIPIIMHEENPTVVFTVRTHTTPSHAGQISFPGGHTHPKDKDHTHTALREAHEEIGLMSEKVEVIGEFGAHYGGTGFVVTPVIGCVAPDVVLSKCEREVADIFEVPLSYIACADNHVIATHDYHGAAYKTYAMPFGQQYIWGLTAGISRTLCEALQE